MMMMMMVVVAVAVAAAAAATTTTTYRSTFHSVSNCLEYVQLKNLKRDVAAIIHTAE